VVSGSASLLGAGLSVRNTVVFHTKTDRLLYGIVQLHGCLELVGGLHYWQPPYLITGEPRKAQLGRSFGVGPELYKYCM
jgi:hypothetical protein